MICRCYLVSNSITFAQKMQKCLTRAGYNAPIARLPAEANLGCGHAVRVCEEELRDVLGRLRECGLKPVKVGMVFDDGRFREIQP